MVKVRDEKASYEVGPVNPAETAELRARSEEQAAAFQHDAPELIFLQDESEFRKDLIELGGTLVKDSGLATLSDTDLLREILNIAHLSQGSNEYITHLERALYIRETAGCYRI